MVSQENANVRNTTLGDHYLFTTTDSIISAIFQYRTTQTQDRSHDCSTHRFSIPTIHSSALLVPHMHHMLSLASLEQRDLLQLIDRGCEFANSSPERCSLERQCIGLEFRKTSTRTRTSFAAAAARLGATPIIFGPNDLQTNTGESLQDTVMVLSKYLRALIVRSAGDPAELRNMADLNVLPIVNAMTADEHPTQALTDVSMIKRQFGRLSALRLLYCGEGNNTAIALAYAISRLPGMEADFRTPVGFGIPADVLQRCAELSSNHGGMVRHSHNPPDPDESGMFDIVYATRWQTTGTSKSNHAWHHLFEPFRVREALMHNSSGPRRPVFMHDLPAVRGEDCDASVLDGPSSIAFQQAEQKLFTAMAVIEWCTET